MNRLIVAACAALFAVAVQAENWPQFRGPSRNGISAEKNLPLAWGTSSNILWKAAIAGEGWSSPIVWGDHVYLSSATENGANCHIMALDRSTGKILWDTMVFSQATRRKESKNSWATPTPVADGKTIFAVFGGGGVAAVDANGKLLWKNQEVEFYSRHGLGASPVLHEGLLIMPFDGSSSRFEASSKVTDSERIGWQIPWDQAFIAALDAKTGKRMWTGKRGESRIAHISPLVLEIDGAPQLVSGAGDRIQGFNIKTGERIWSIYAQGEGVAPSPVAGNGMLFASSGFEKTTLRAVKLKNIKGEATETHVAWEQKKGCPTQPSPIFVNGRLFGLSDGGVLTRYNPADGEVIWQERVGGNFSASPVFADGKLYFLSEQGETTVTEAGDDFKILARSPLNERCQASMAVSQGRLYIRSEKHLYCIAEK